MVSNGPMGPVFPQFKPQNKQAELLPPKKPDPRGKSYTQVKSDPNKPYPISVTVLASADQDNKSQSDEFRPGGNFTNRLLDKVDKGESFVGGYKAIEKELYSPKFAQDKALASNKLEDLNKKIRSESDPQKKKALQDALKLAEKENDYLNTTRRPVSSANMNVEGWKPGDKNPKTAILMMGKPLNDRDAKDFPKDIENMKQRLLKQGLKEEDIHIVTNPEELKKAMEKVETFGKKNEGQSPAAMLYFSGHNDNDNDELSNNPSGNPNGLEQNIPDTKGEGLNKGSFLFKNPTTGEDQRLHEYGLKDLMGKHMKGFDKRTLMILDTCFAGNMTAKNTPKQSNFNPFTQPKRSDATV